MPLALVSLGSDECADREGFDVSVGALITLSVVIASYMMTPMTSTRG